MFIAAAVLAVLTALMATFSASLKLRRDPRVVESIQGTVGVPATWFPWLAAAELAGAAGLLVGLAWAPLGIAAAAGLVAYFVGAIIAHLRVKDMAGLGAPVVPLVLSIASLVTRVLSA
jgi:sorbitol-specific phosphotransferase system component IIC